MTQPEIPFACSLTCCWPDGDDRRAVGFHRGRVARRFQEVDGVRERGLGDGPRALPVPFFTNYYFPSPHPLCEVPDLGVGGGRAGSRSAAAYGAGGGGKSGRAFFPFFCVIAVCKATVTGALSRPRRSAARTPSQTLSTFL